MDLWNDDATQPMSTREELWLEDAHAFAKGSMSSFESEYDLFCTQGDHEFAFDEGAFVMDASIDSGMALEASL